MKFFDIVWKEISLVKSQKIALALILLYPLLVIVLLGSAFSGGLDISKFSSTKIGLLDNLAFDSNISSRLSTIKEVKIVEFDDLNLLKQSIKTKDLAAGIRLSGASKNEQIKVELIYDNSNLMSSRYFIEIAKAMMQRITVETAQNELGSIWRTITSFGNNIESERQNVLDFKSKLVSAEASLDDLESDLKALDFAEIESELSTQKSNVDTYNTKANQFQREVSDFKTSFSEMKAEYASMKTKLSAYSARLKAMPSQLALAKTGLGEIIASLESVKTLVPTEDGKKSIDDSIAKLNAQKSELEAWESLVNDLISVTDNILDNQSKLNQSIAKADSLFARVDAESAQINSVLSSSSSSISEMRDKLGVFKKSVDEVKTLIAESRKSKTEIEGQLNESEALLSSFSTQLKDFSGINPKILAQPVVFYEAKMFEIDSKWILVVNSIVVVLILTCMLLTSILVLLEKNQNVSLRLKLSRTSRGIFLLGKVVGQLVIAFVEVGIILSYALISIPLPFKLGSINSIGLGLTLNASPLELFAVVFVISLSFVCLGILISFFTKNQSTAILASLLLVVPMLFLSGIILPIEFMEPFMQLLSSFLPLTIANNLLLGLLVKGSVITELWFGVMVLLGFSFAVIIAHLIGKD